MNLKITKKQLIVEKNYKTLFSFCKLKYVRNKSIVWDFIHLKQPATKPRILPRLNLLPRHSLWHYQVNTNESPVVDTKESVEVLISERRTDWVRNEHKDWLQTWICRRVSQKLKRKSPFPWGWSKVLIWFSKGAFKTLFQEFWNGRIIWQTFKTARNC